MKTKIKTTPREKTIIKLMEMVIDTLSYCDDLSDPAFSMYETMKHAVDGAFIEYDEALEVLENLEAN